MKVIAAVCGVCCALLLGSAAGAQTKTTGAEAWKALIGNTIVGKSEGGADLVEYYAPDGGVRQKIVGSPDKGTWTLKGDKVCLKYETDDDEEPDCYAIAVEGDNLVYTDDEKNNLPFKILKGNPNNL